MSVAVYIVRPGENEELRYSLRSVEANLPEVTDVVIVGHIEPWLRNVERIDGNPYRSQKRRNVWANVYTAATHPDLPDDIILMNDDFMVTRPATVEMNWRSTLDEHIKPLSVGWWRRSLEVTRTYLRRQGYANLLSYELHRPFPMNRQRMATVMNEASGIQPDNPPQWRTLYGNRWQVGGTQDDDGKVYKTAQPTPSGPWLSTTDGQGFQNVQPMLAKLFPERCRWER